MFRGVHNLNLDTKGRIAIPVKYRERLVESCSGNLIITVDPDKCLLIYPMPVWEVIETKLTSLPNLDKRVRRQQRIMLGHASELDMDSQGRVLLPAPLREFAGLEKRAVLMGQGKKFELWNEDTFNELRDQWFKQEGENEDIAGILESISI